MGQVKSKTKYQSNHVPDVAIFAYVTTNITTPNGYRTIKSISFTSSGQGKYFVYRNEELVATLFSSALNKNVFYNLPIKIGKKDIVGLKCQNMDLSPKDMYYTVEFES